MKKILCSALLCYLAVQVDAINAEEDAFGWPTTVYPTRVKALTALKPILQLYQMMVDYKRKHEYADTTTPGYYFSLKTFTLFYFALLFVKHLLFNFIVNSLDWIFNLLNVIHSVWILV